MRKTIRYLQHSLLALAFSICCQPLTAQSILPLIFDRHQSQYVGAHDLLFLHKALYSFQDRYIPDTIPKETKPVRKGMGIGYRMGKLFLLDFQEDFLAVLLQHEGFGHCGRFREFGFKGNTVEISPFFPFGNGSGASDYNPGFREITPHQRSAITIGGVEANKVLGSAASLNFMQTGTIHYREALIYLLAENNQLYYIWMDRLRTSRGKNGGDMAGYVRELNEMYAPGQTRYTIEQLSVQSLVTLANPLQLYAAYTLLYSYGITGRKHLSHIPMIRIGNTRYLPYFNYNLTPFGSEYTYCNVVKYRDKMFTADLGVSEGTFNKFYRVKAKALNLAGTPRAGINLHLEAWSQPELNLDPYKPTPTGNKTGGLIKADLSLAPFRHNSTFNLFAQLGYKTKGFTIGEPLTEGVIVRYGLGLRM